MKAIQAIALRKLACIGVLAICLGITPGWSQTDESDADACDEVTVTGLASSFPDESTVYTRVDGGDGVRATYVSDTHFIWYSATDPTEWTADTWEADSTVCTGSWVLSTYPIVDSFTDLDWYQTSGATCEDSPTGVAAEDWVRMTRDCDSCDSSSADAVVSVTCLVTNDEGEEDDDGEAVSSRTVIILIIIGGVAFMVLLCLGALMCCLRGKNSPEEAVMPPGELTETSNIGSKVGANKPGLHAHPEREGSEHPRPEDCAPSHSTSSEIPRGSRSGPSVRSIGYT